MRLNLTFTKNALLAALTLLIITVSLMTAAQAGAANGPHWFFWRHATATGIWQCVGHVNAPLAAANKIALVDSIGYAGTATVYVSSSSHGCP